MYRFLRSPRWIAALIVVATVVSAFVALGNWQLTRHREVRLDNQISSARIAAEPVDLDAMLSAAGESIDSLENRRASTRGVFEPGDELLVRNQVNTGTAGFHIVTPFRFDGGTILVNRGWVPLELDTPPIAAAAPLSVTFGNAPAVTLHVGGRPVTIPAPPAGGTVSRFKIEADGTLR